MCGHIEEMSIGQIKNYSSPEEYETADFEAMVQSAASKTRFNSTRTR